MNRTFRLAAVERIRSARLAESARALAQTRRDLRDADASRALLRENLLGCVADTVARPGDVLSAAEYRALLRDRIALMDGRIAELGRRTEAAQARWLAARAELRAVEALHDRHRALLLAEQDRLDQRALDELATVRHRSVSVIEPNGHRHGVIALRDGGYDDLGGDAA